MEIFTISIRPIFDDAYGIHDGQFSQHGFHVGYRFVGSVAELHEASYRTADRAGPFDLFLMEMGTVESSLDAAGLLQFHANLYERRDVFSDRDVDDIVGISLRHAYGLFLSHHHDDVPSSGLPGLVTDMRMLQVTGIQPFMEQLCVGRLGKLRIFRPRILSFRRGFTGLGP